jgi:von Willebrand factor type A domain/Aerotolerance regulator N-terminal
MTLLAPWALWFLLVAGGVVVLYLLKIKRRTATVPVLEFWIQLAGQTKVHSLFNRLKRLLSMLLWLVIVACLILALGNPILSLGKIKPRAIAVIIDNSASMQAFEKDSGGKSRLALAKEALTNATGGRPVNDEWLLIEATREPRVLQPWTFETKAIRRAADKLTPFNGAADLAEAVRLAGQLLAGKQDPCILVISDGAAGAALSLAAADPRIVYWPIGKTRDNAGIGQLAVRPDRQNGNYQALITVINGSDQKLDTQLTLEIDGRSQSVELVSAEPGATWEKTVTIDALNGGVLRASLDHSDALALDNEAFAVLPPIRPAVVWLVSDKETSFFFEHALASMDPLVGAADSLTIWPDQYEKAAASLNAPETTLKHPDLIIFNGWIPPKLPDSGRFVIVNACPDELAKPNGDPLAAPQLHLDPTPHAITQHLTLQGSRLARANRITLKQPARILAQSADSDPLIALIQQPDRQTLLVSFDILDSDLPFRNAFPLLLRNTVAYMHEDAPSWLRTNYAAGETIRPLRPIPPAAPPVLHILRAGKSEEVKPPVINQAFSFTSTNMLGAVRLDVADQASFAAINIGDPSESSIAPAPASEDAAARLGLSRRLLGGMPWAVLAMIAAFGVVFEWLSYHFRWTE